ncbi:MAG TPA: hypothetical protein VG937_34355 [Polyangiaceae bacterium]|nr:hypothetical protein [Polyangiaceae bacterium]
MSTDADSVPARKPRSSSAPAQVKKKKKKGVKPKIARPLTEQEINAPDMQTLIMIGVLCGLAITLWAFAHAGCNYHPPRETRRPRVVTTAELTREPKDAAIEFQHRLLTLDFKGALEIAGGPLPEEVKKSQAACGADCLAKKKNLTQAVTSAVVLERSPMNAKVRVTTYHLPTGDQSFLTLVEREPSGWKVTARVADAPGATLPGPFITPAQPLRLEPAPAPAGSENPHGLRLMPAPAGSASAHPALAPAPVGSAH